MRYWGIVALLGLAALAWGQVDWTAGTVRAVGYGTPPAGGSGPQAAVLARRAAIVDAQRNLLEALEGVRLTAATTVRQAMVENDVIATHVAGFVRGARPVRERTLPNGAVEVEIAVGLYGGTESLAGQVDLPSRLPPAPASAAPQPAVAATGGYTGLLIDCRGLDLSRAMAPALLDDTGAMVWGADGVSYDLLLEKGLAGYYTSVEQAVRMGRVGPRPLVITAVRAEGNGGIKTNPVMTRADAARLLAEDARTHFLAALAVGCITD